VFSVENCSGKKVDIFGVMILTSICDKMVCFFIELPRNKGQFFAVLHNTKLRKSRKYKERLM